MKTIQIQFEHLFVLSVSSFFVGDQCPMYFNDGSYPWGLSESFIQIFNWDFVRSSSSIVTPTTISVAIIGLIYSIFKNNC